MEDTFDKRPRAKKMCKIMRKSNSGTIFAIFDRTSVQTTLWRRKTLSQESLRFLLRIRSESFLRSTSTKSTFSTSFSNYLATRILTSSSAILSLFTMRALLLPSCLSRLAITSSRTRFIQCLGKCCKRQKTSGLHWSCTGSYATAPTLTKTS